jgi:hypothetical protein
MIDVRVTGGMRYGGSEPTPCALCGENVDPGMEAQAIGTPEGFQMVHRECLLRSTLGGIGHLQDHAYWCCEMHDPDGGRTFRQSALEVDVWVHEHGID